MAITFDVETTAKRLEAALANVQWAVAQIPPESSHAPLATAPDEWHPAMNLAHMTIYDEFLARPLLEALARGEDGAGSVRFSVEAQFLQDSIDLSAEPIDAILARLTAAREAHIATVRSFSANVFNAPATPIFAFGGVHRSPGWIATKTLQHTWEHGNAILRSALFAPRAD